ncbi:division/cell wall cluster transcriptional repressor MraZ [Pontivivens ytuae]|uniref:Transcriptional regulator MraZ n=1 Tax=Pontivivens ytuae TaxID=2789856 RepID=A0A7S9LPS8_9RHOB|nr:division/cell wall cluster transcriptional repressor MraZ [Pontivivens ytuae]
MALRFRGEWTHKVDAKGRVSVPAPFRRVLEAGAPGWQSGDPVPFVVVKNQDSQPCLNVYSVAEIELIDDEIYALPRFTEERDRIARRLASGSANLTLDENGRFGLTAEMREKTGIGDQAVFSGMVERFQIWSPEGFEAVSSGAMPSEPDPENLFELIRAAKAKYNVQ